MPMLNTVTEQELAARAVAPRVTEADIEAAIAGVWFFNAGECVDRVQPVTADPPLYLLTICVLVLRNGFTVTGTSAVASPANFDADIGKRVARADAVRQIWPLLGFQLRDRIHHAPAMSDAVAALMANVETCDTNAQVNREGMLTNPTKAAMYEALGASYRAAIARLVP
jgi:hypothetical protein